MEQVQFDSLVLLSPPGSGSRVFGAMAPRKRSSKLCGVILDGTNQR